MKSGLLVLLMSEKYRVGVAGVRLPYDNHG